MMEMGVAGAMTFMSTEMEEWLYPVLVKQQEIKIDSQGAGQWRGGPGVTTHVTGHGSSAMDVYTACWGHNQFEPRGPSGGSGGNRRNRLRLRSGEAPTERHFYSGLGKFQLPKGWGVRGDRERGVGATATPYDRDPAAVAEDVRDEIVSIEAARHDYGVVLDAETLAVDEAATAALRRRAQGGARSPAPAQLADGARHLDAAPEPDDQPRYLHRPRPRPPPRIPRPTSTVVSLPAHLRATNQEPSMAYVARHRHRRNPHGLRRIRRGVRPIGQGADHRGPDRWP